MGSQIIKMFAPKDDEVRLERNDYTVCDSYNSMHWFWLVFICVGCLSSMQVWRCRLSSGHWTSSKWWPLCVMHMTDAATLKLEQLSLVSSRTTRWGHRVQSMLLSFILSTRMNMTKIMAHLLPSVVSGVRPAALHRRPQTIHVSLSWEQQKVYSIRYGLHMSCLFSIWTLVAPLY